MTYYQAFSEPIPYGNESAYSYSSEQALSDKEMNFNAEQAALNRQFQAEQSQIAREWQEKMRNSELSSAFAQARENGLNPYALFSSANISTPGTSVPSGSTASYSGYAAANRSAVASERNTERNNTTSLRVAGISAISSMFNSALSAVSSLGRASILASKLR